MLEVDPFCNTGSHAVEKRRISDPTFRIARPQPRDASGRFAEKTPPSRAAAGTTPSISRQTYPCPIKYHCTTNMYLIRMSWLRGNSPGEVPVIPGRQLPLGAFSDGCECISGKQDSRLGARNRIVCASGAYHRPELHRQRGQIWV